VKHPARPQQINLIELQRVEAPPPEWIRVGSSPFKIHTYWIHQASGWQIHHCRHPTANFPYYILTPDGRRVVNPRNGRGFQRLHLAQEHVEEFAPKERN